MSFNIKAVIRVCGLVMIMIGLLMLLPLMISLLYGERDTAISFVLCALPMVVTGSILHFRNKTASGNFRKRESILAVALSWVLISVLGAVPFFITGSTHCMADAIFESTSGFTTTGASVIDNVEILPKGILFWRALTHWFGGLGIILIAISIIPSFEYNGHIIASVEASNHVEDKVTAKTSDTVKRIFIYYLILTALCTLFLLIGGMNGFDSITHAFSTISTGGFSNYNNSIAHFQSYYINWVLIVFMLLGSTNFTLYYFLFSKHWREFFEDTEFRWYVAILAFATFVSSLSLVLSGEGDIIKIITLTCFEMVTTASTTGFAVSDYNLWPTTCIMLVLLLMLMGGSTSSTAGGIKTYRIVVMIKLIHRNIIRRLHPAAVVKIKSDEGAVHTESIQSISAFIYLYIFTVFAGTFVIAIFNNDMMTSLSAVVSSISNVGPGFNKIGPTSTYSSFNDFSKLFLSFLMIVGRLELFGIIIIFISRFWNPDRRRRMI